MFLAACAENAPQDYTRPEGPAARTIDNLGDPVFVVAGVVFLLVEGLILFIAIRFRQRKGHEDDVPVQTHGNTLLEIGWTVVPALILAAIAVPTLVTIFDLEEEPDDPLRVNVTGQQWWWQFEYPQDEVVTANELVIPAGRPVYLSMTANDVIHSFWVPKLNGKRDVVPGRTSRITIEADRPGVYLGQCTEYCGLSHAYMRNRVVALSPGEFDDWLDNQRREARPAVRADARAGEDLFGGFCATCHQVDGRFEPERVPLKAGVAPNLTHLMTRSVFAGGIFELNRPNLEAWLRDPPARKPMDPENQQGMPNLNLTEDQIDQLVDYLETLD